MRKARVAIVHDYFVHVRGAERVTQLLAEMLPEADIYLLIAERSALPAAWKRRTIVTSPLSSLPRPERLFRALFPVYPYVVEGFDFGKYDLVVSSSSGFAHGAITQPGTCHICCSHSPFRYAWSGSHEFLAQQPPLRRVVLHALLHRVRQWDRLAAQGVDHYVANSQVTSQRIRKFYQRESTVIHYPIEVQRFTVGNEVEDYYLLVSGLVPYKRVDVAVEAFSRLGRNLKVVGDGPNRPQLTRLAGPTVEFLGHVNDDMLRSLYSRCQALIMTADEDYGLTPLEAQASGRPVIAYRAGGVLETVIDGVTGVFFDSQTPEALAETVRSFDAGACDPQRLRQHALTFDIAAFRQVFAAFAEQRLAQHRASVGLDPVDSPFGA